MLKVKEEQSNNIKQPKTFDELIEKLEERKLIINDKEYAKKCIMNINYYRLSGYYRFFYTDSEEFKKGTTFEDIYKLYCFDRELRLILFNLMQDLEIMIRSHLAYEIAHKYGSDSFNLIDLFFNYDENEIKKKVNMCEKYINFINNIEKKLKRSKEEFINHHKENYNDKFPIWVTVEVLDFGDLSRLYKNMKNVDKKIISKKYYSGNSHLNVESWLEKSVILRNICAHHSRVVGRNVFNVKNNKNIKQFKVKGLFALILGVKELIIKNNEISWNRFVSEMIILSNDYNSFYFDKLGFPKEWIEILKIQIK